MKALLLFLAMSFAATLAHGQDMPGMVMPPAPKPQLSAPAQQDLHDTAHTQEPEHPDHHTGRSVAAPELLTSLNQRPPLGLADFLKMAQISNPTVAEANAIAKRSAGHALEAGLYPNPTIGYQGEQIRGGSYGGGEQGAYLEQEIVLGGKLALRRDVYRQQQRADGLGAEAQKLRVENDVTQAFYKALEAQALIAVRRELLQVALDATETSHQLANVGQADAPDILEAEMEAEQSKLDYEMAQHSYISAFHTLATLTGRLDFPLCGLVGDLEQNPEIDTAADVPSPSLQQTQQAAEVIDARLKAARREVMPNLTLRAGEQYNFEHVTDFPAKPAGPQSFASASIMLPLWNRHQGEIAAEAADVERARKAVVRERLALQQHADVATQAFLSARSTADRYRTELIPRAVRAYELYKTKYDAMALPYPQVLHAQRILLQMRIGYLTALGEVWRNATDLQHGTLRGALEMPVQ